MSDQYQQEQIVAIEAVRRAAALCRTVQAQITPDVLEKKDRKLISSFLHGCAKICGKYYITYILWTCFVWDLCSLYLPLLLAR